MTLCHDLLGIVGTKANHLSKAQANRRRTLATGLDHRVLTIDRQHRHGTVFGIANQRGGWVEPHWLLHQERTEKSGGMVSSQPGALVGQQGKSSSVRFGKAKGREGDDLLKDALRNVLGDVALGCALGEGQPLGFDCGTATAPTHSASQGLCLAWRKARERLCDGQYLVLKDDHAKRLAQRLLKQWVLVRDWHCGIGPTCQPSLNVGVDSTTLDRSRANQCDLDDQVVKTGWLHAQQCLHLCTRFDLKDTDRVCGLDLGVDLGIVERHA